MSVPDLTLSMPKLMSMSLSSMSMYILEDDYVWNGQEETNEPSSSSTDYKLGELSISISQTSNDLSDTNEDFEWATPPKFTIPSFSFLSHSFLIPRNIDEHGTICGVLKEWLRRGQEWVHFDEYGYKWKW